MNREAFTRLDLPDTPTPPVQWAIDVANTQTDECITGRSAVWLAGRNYGSVRFICTIAHGPAPGADYEAAHACTTKGCVNPRHLSWKTRSGNMLDKHRDGTSAHAVLTESAVAYIRRSDDTDKDLAARFGVSASTVNAARNYRTWKHLP